MPSSESSLVLAGDFSENSTLAQVSLLEWNSDATPAQDRLTKGEEWSMQPGVLISNPSNWLQSEKGLDSEFASNHANSKGMFYAGCAFAPVDICPRFGAMVTPS